MLQAQHSHDVRWHNMQNKIPHGIQYPRQHTRGMIVLIFLKNNVSKNLLVLCVVVRAQATIQKVGMVCRVHSIVIFLLCYYVFLIFVGGYGSGKCTGKIVTTRLG